MRRIPDEEAFPKRSADGADDANGRVTRFVEIVLRPRLTVAAGTDRDRVHHLLEKTEKACLVSASLSTPIRLEPDIVEQPGVATSHREPENAHQ